jgi:hypothetical protein
MRETGILNFEDLKISLISDPDREVNQSFSYQQISQEVVWEMKIFQY